MKPTTEPKVIIRHCDAYDAERIREIVKEGLEELDLRPHGRTLLKPNLVSSGPDFQHAYTRPEFTEGVLMALKDRDEGDVTELAVGERCGITIPTRHSWEGAGYGPMVKRVGGVKHYFFEEEPQVEIPLSHEGRLRDYLFTPEPVAKADFFVNCPKFKAHPWTTVTFSTKAYIGIQDDRHRLIDHDHRLNEKIADLQYIIQPQFIAIDAITAGEGRMLTPIPFDLNLVIMGNNSVAFDAVCSAIIGLDAADIEHIKLTADRGFGTVNLDEIAISGDVTLEEAQTRAKGFRTGLIRVEDYFEGTHISAYAGPPPEKEHTSYCWGGCPGAIEEAIEILRQTDENIDEDIAHMHVVFGAYEGPINAKEGERVIFIGDCAKWEGDLGGQTVSVESLYKDRSTKDPYDATDETIIGKALKLRKVFKKAEGEPYLRLQGCPVSVAEQVIMLADVGGLKSPVNDPESLRMGKNILKWKGAMALKSMTGHKYQVHGETERGEASPELPETTGPAQ